MHMFLANADTYIYEASRNGNGAAQWGGALQHADIGTTVHTGAVASLANGELRMMVKENTEFREYYKPPGNPWNMVQFTSSITELTNLTTGTIDNPNLTPDGRILVFTVAGSTGGDGIWFIERPDLGHNFSVSANADAYGPLVQTSAVVASPILASGCVLYAVVSGDLVKYTP
jgi:hypothetical protein